MAEEAASIEEVAIDPLDIENTSDGGAFVTLDDGEGTPDYKAHFANLAEALPFTFLSELGSELHRLVTADKKAREKRDEQYAEGIRRTGLGKEAPGGADFDGASKVVHPMLVEACVDFAARSIKELFPPSGPVKDYVPGDWTREKAEKAQRKVRHLNWQLTVQLPAFRAELEQGLTQVPLGGAAYLKLSFDEERRRPVPEFIPIDHIFLPAAASSFYTAERKTHQQPITESEYRRRVASKMYRDVNLVKASMPPETTAADKASEKVEGKTPDAENIDGEFNIWETVCYRTDIEPELSGNRSDDATDVTYLPYLVTIDSTSMEVLGIYRNWEPDDKVAQEIVSIIEFPFVPWRGALPIGLANMIGDLSGAATGTLRALLDAALIANFPGAVKLKGGGKGGETIRIQPTGVTELEGSVVADDIRKQLMALPFPGPSPVLFELLGFLVDAGRGVVRTTFENLADQKVQNAPVGTTLALIEQGLTVFSAIHGRLHAAMQRLLEVLCRLNRTYLEDGDLLDEAGELLARREDYTGPADVVPVSDPNIFSETQRFAQIQAVLSRSDNHPELYNQRAVEERFLQRLKIPEYEELLVKQPDPKPMNAVNENVAAVLGRPLTAFPQQDHLAHLQTHLDFLASPFLGSARLIAPTFVPAVLSHLREHLALWYVATVYQLLAEATATSPEELMDADPDVSARFDRLIAVASSRVIQHAPQVFKEVPRVIEQAFKVLQALTPPAITDPTLVAAEASAAETKRKADADRTKALADAKKLAQEAQVTAEKLRADAAQLAAELEEAARDRAHDEQLERMRQAAEDARQRAELAAREAMNASDNATALALAEMEIESGERVAVSTGTGINPNP